MERDDNFRKMYLSEENIGFINNINILNHSIKIMLVFFIIIIYLFGFQHKLFAKEEPLVILTAEERHWLDSNKDNLVMYFNVEFPPIEFISEKGTFTGLGSDVISLVEKKLGVKFIKKPSDDWVAHLSALKSGECAIAPTIVKTTDRETYAFFTTVYAKVPVVIITQNMKKDYDKLEDLNGLKVGVVEGYASQKYLEDQALINQFKVVLVKDVSDGLEKVSFGQIDAFAGNLAVAAYYISKKGISNLKVTYKTDYEFSWSIGISRKYPLLYSSIQKALDTITNDEYVEMRKRWISLNQSPTISDETMLLLKFIGIFIILLVISLLGISYILKLRLNQKITDLEKSENRYKRLAENSPAVIFQLLKTLEGHFSFPYISQALFGITGLQSEALTLDSEAFFNNIPDEDLKMMKEDILKSGTYLKATQISFRFEKDDQPIWLEMHLTPEILPDDSILWDGFFIDITYRKKAEDSLKENQRFLADLLDNSATIIIVKDHEGRYQLVNRKWEDTIGQNRKDVIGKTDLEIFPTESAQMFINNDQEVFKNRTIIQREETIETVNGTQWFFSIKFPLYNSRDELIGLCGIITDITKHKQIEEALKQRIIALTKPLDHVSDIEFEDIFNIQDIQRLQDEFSDATGVATIITRPDGTPLTQPGNFTRFCNDLVRKSSKGCINCYKSDAAIGKLCMDGPTIQTCLSGGLWDAGAGISIGGKHIANWLIGQIRDETQTEENIRRYAKEIEVDPEELVRAFREVPSMSKEKFMKISKMLYTLATQLSNFAYQNIQQARFIAEREKAEEALLEAEKKYRRLVDNSQSIIYTINPEGTMTFVSPSWKKILGHTQEEIVGRKFEYVVHPEDIPLCKAYFINSDEENRTQGVEYRVFHKDGTIRWHRSVITPVFDNNDSLISLVGNTVDITDFKQAQESITLAKERLDAAMNASNSGLWDWIVPTNQVYYDPRYYRMAGYEPDEFPHNFQEWEKRVHPDDLDYCHKEINSYFHHEIKEFSIEFRFLCKDSTWMWIRSFGKAVEFNERGEIVRIIGAHVDITDRKRSDEIISSYNRELEKIINVASHDLRSPLVNVDGYSRELENSINEIKKVLDGDSITGNASEKLIKEEFTDMINSLNHIRNSARQMDFLIKGLLKISRSGRETLVIKNLDMNRLVGKVISSYGFKIGENRVKLDVRKLHPCRGDEVQVIQVFSNLIGNALKFVDKTRELSIEISSEKTNNYTVYHVKDTGIGIAKESQEKIFDLFHRLNPKDYEGEGLGLSIVQQILGRLEGKITLDSEIGRGCCFNVYLPIVEKIDR